MSHLPVSAPAAPRRSIARWLGRALLWLLAALLLLSAAGAYYQAAGTAADAHRFPPAGQLVDVGGYRMHIHCQGQGSPTVVLDSMSAGTSPYWARIQPQVAAVTRVCAFDRAGWGWSDDGPEPRDADQSVRELHTLLERSGESGPWVMVGHSLGGMYAQLYAARYADELAGLLLLDSAHPLQAARLSAEAQEEGRVFGQMLPMLSVINRLGVMRLFFSLGGELDFSNFPEQPKAEIKALWSLPRHWDSQIREGAVRPQTDAQVAAAGSLGSLPLTVVTAERSPAEWLALQSDLLALSSNSRQIIVPGSGHATLVFNAKHAHATADAILQLVLEARAQAAP